MVTYTSFKDLDCWQKSRDAKIWLYNFLKKIPKKEFDIHDNLKRAARSSTRNIAEGFGRFHYKENIQFCRISRGSLFEILDDLDNLVVEGFSTKQDVVTGEEMVNQAIQSLNGYIKYLKKKFENK